MASTPLLYLTFGLPFLSTVVSDVFALTTIHVFILGVIKGLKLNIFIFIYFNLGDDIGEDHTLGELFLSMKSPGDTYPALFELCHTRDFKASSFWTGVPIFLVILNLCILSDILNVE